MDMGAATGSVTFFRQMGGAIGVAGFGAVFGIRLAHYVAGIGGGGPTPDVNDVDRDPGTARADQDAGADGDGDALDDLFLVGVPIVALALVVALFLPGWSSGPRRSCPMQTPPRRSHRHRSSSERRTPRWSPIGPPVACARRGR